MIFFSNEVREIIIRILEESWQIFSIWWWFLLPFFLFPIVRDRYKYWIQERWDATVPKILLEIKVPRDIVKPIRAMEHVFAGFHATHDVLTKREEWLEGQFQLSFTIEIVSIGGEIHFYIRCPRAWKSLIESNIYAYYPEVEIEEVEDYTKNVPQDIPNEEWDIWGTEMMATKEDFYPLKTYPKFEKETALEATEEKRIDPFAQLLEGMASLKEGENLWLQIRLTPVLSEKSQLEWVKRALEHRDKLAKRPIEKKVEKPMIQEAIEIWLPGWEPIEKKEEKKEVMPPEMKLTPGEKEIVQAIEEKISKLGYNCIIRFVYLAPRKVFFKARVQLAFAFFKIISSQTLLGLKPNKYKQTKVKSILFWFLDERRLYWRKRRMFRSYIRRLPWTFPRPSQRLKDFYFLNTEELATIFHFPSKQVAPTPGLPRIEARKSQPPPTLPIEQ
jgi:hypothetical protein